MHELWLCQNIMEIVKQQAANYTQVKTINLEMGKLAAIDKAALIFSFDVVKNGTIAEHAVLNIVEINPKAWCKACQKNFAISQYYDPCPYCNGHVLKITQGEELQIKSIEVE